MEPAGHRPSTVPSAGKSGRGYSPHGRGGAVGPAAQWPEYINNELARSIGNNIQTARLDADGKSRGNLTQKELAEMANQQDKELRLNTRRIGDIERGYRIVNLRELVAISAALGKSVHEMITGERPEFYQLTEKYGLTQKVAQTLPKSARNTVVATKIKATIPITRSFLLLAGAFVLFFGIAACAEVEILDGLLLPQFIQNSVFSGNSAPQLGQNTAILPFKFCMRYVSDYLLEPYQAF